MKVIKWLWCSYSDYLDIVKDPISSGDYKKEEDPKLFISEKTKRGPLTDNWLAEYARDSKIPGKKKCVMTAYKLCRVEFKYWGMQNKIERFIHDIGLYRDQHVSFDGLYNWTVTYYKCCNNSDDWSALLRVFLINM